MAHNNSTLSREKERKLIDRARSGESASVRELVDVHKDRLFAFIWRFIRNHHDAEEICQDAFLRAFASLDTFRVEYRFSTWLFTIGYRVCLNRLRRKRLVTGDWERDGVQAETNDTSTATLESEDASQLRERIWEAVDTLSAPQRAAVLLFYRHEMGCSEIAHVLELPIATVKSHLHRARNRLRQTLESLGDQQLEDIRNLSRQAG